MSVDFETMALPDPGDRRLVTYFASDAASATAIDRIVRIHGGQVVGIERGTARADPGTPASDEQEAAG